LTETWPVEAENRFPRDPPISFFFPAPRPFRACYSGGMEVKRFFWYFVFFTVFFKPSLPLHSKPAVGNWFRAGAPGRFFSFFSYSSFFLGRGFFFASISRVARIRSLLRLPRSTRPHSGLARFFPQPSSLFFIVPKLQLPLVYRLQRPAWGRSSFPLPRAFLD